MDARHDRSDLRPLNTARPITVVVADGRPVALVEHGARLAIERVAETWEVDVAWWRVPTRRVYFRVVLAGGIVRTIYRDPDRDAWFAQAYG